MALGRRKRVSVLVAVVLWAATPLFACLPGLGTKTQRDCCAAMMQDCGASMSGSCCRLAPTHNLPAITSAYAPEHGQQSGVIWLDSSLRVVVDSAQRSLTFDAMPPPDPSPGGHSVLRI